MFIFELFIYVFLQLFSSSSLSYIFIMGEPTLTSSPASFYSMEILAGYCNLLFFTVSFNWFFFYIWNIINFGKNLAFTLSTSASSALVFVSRSWWALVNSSFVAFSSSTVFDSSSAFCFWDLIRSLLAFSFSFRISFSFLSAYFVYLRSTSDFFISSSFLLRHFPSHWLF